MINNRDKCQGYIVDFYAIDCMLDGEQKSRFTTAKKSVLYFEILARLLIECGIRD